jgi:hypothetical protein
MSPTLLNPFALGGAGGGGFKPTDISGCLLWLSADAITGYTDGQTINNGSTWNDSSGNNNHATSAVTTSPPKYRTATGPGGGPAVEFQATGYASGSGYFNLPSGLMSGVTELEVHIGVKATTSTESGAPIILNDSNDAGFFPYTDGKIYETLGTTARKAGFTPGLAINAWRRYNVWSKSNDYAIKLDETSQYSDSSNTVDVGITGQTPPKVGASSASGTSQPRRFVGSVSFVLVYNKKLSTTERSDLVTFLQAHPSGGTP